MTNHIYSKRKKHAIKFYLIAFCNYVYILLLVWIFVQPMLLKTILFKQDQKKRKNKAEKVIVQSNLNSSFVFLF